MAAVLYKVRSTRLVVKEPSIEAFCDCSGMAVWTSVDYEDLDYPTAWHRVALLFSL